MMPHFDQWLSVWTTDGGEFCVEDDPLARKALDRALWWRFGRIRLQQTQGTVLHLRRASIQGWEVSTPAARQRWRALQQQCQDDADNGAWGG